MTYEAASTSPTATLTIGDKDFAEIRAIIRDVTGISMGDSKRHLIFRRLGVRLKATNIHSFGEYIDRLKSGDPSELEAFTNSVTTNLTSFFREKHHFEFLAETALPEIVGMNRNAAKRLRIWSAGCSTGEEPYSIAMTLLESMQELSQWDARILCTDIDSDVLDICRAGIYAQQRVEKLTDTQLRRWFRKSRDQSDGKVKVSAQLQDLIAFRQLNLMHVWPMKRRFDIIFCRNVIIYFDKPTQRVLINRFADSLEDGAYLILGHSESLFNVSDRFLLVGNTIYQKKSA